MMRRAVIDQIQGMSRRLKFNLILLLLLFVSVFMSNGLFRPQEVCAAVATVNNWPATPQVLLNGIPAWTTVTAANGAITVGAGSNRAMIVVVACEYSAAPPSQKLSVTYGGQSVSQITTNILQNSTIWLGYLNEASLAAAGSGQTLLVKNQNATNLTAMYASAAVYSGVDQTASPISGFSTQATASATTITPAAYNVTAQAANAGLSLVVANWNTTTATLSVPGYTASPATYAGANFRMGFYNKSITATGTETPVPTVTAASGGAMAGFGLVPNGLKYTISICSDCHYYYPVDAPTTRGTPAGRFKGSHNKHAGSVDGQYGYACTACHYDATTTKHSTGLKNISGSRVPRNTYGGTTNIPITNNEASFSTCTKSTCHSTGRSNIQYTPSIAWGTNGTTTCLSCHAGRSATNPYPQANSTAGFKLSTTHSQHLKYPAANMNCQMCHGKTAANATTLKSYSGVMYHANGVANVIFTDLSYGSYSSYKSTTSGSSANTRVCSNVACHGGKSRSSWTNQSPANNNHTCTHCHGTASGIGTSNTNRNFYAPGYNSGTSTDGLSNSNDVRVGAHFVHLTSVYMKKLKCNECHRVPTTAFDGTHMTGPRYNSQSITFGQASTATKNSVFTSFTSGTAVKAATCSTTYCHGSKMPLSDTSGTYKKPSWNLDLTNNTPSTTVCGRCHGAPPTAGTSAGAHSGATLTGANACSTCHGSVVNSTGVVINKLLHINGIVESAGGDCTSVSCHGAASLASPIAGGLGGPATRRNVVAEHKNTWSHKRSSGGGVPANIIVTKADCIVCHMEGEKATGGTTTAHKDGYIDLRDPDTGLQIKNVTWNGATPGAYVAGATDLRFVQFSRNLAATLESDPNFLVIAAIQQNNCLKCHDTNGASNANAQVTTGGTAMRPFGVAITNHAAPLGSNGSGNVVDVNKSFLTSNATYHPVTGKQNNGFADINLLTAPWNVKTGAGTAAVYGPLMSCWDCHAPAGASGAQTRTVTAHGGPATLRSPIWAGGTTAAANLCLVCHSVTAYPSAAGNHGAASAFTGGANNMGGDMPTCHICHSTYTNARPVRAEDVHGFNDKTPGTVNSKWASGSKPYSFFRTSELGDWAPKAAAGDTLLRTSTCNSGNCSNNNMNGTNGIVGTGGTY